MKQRLPAIFFGHGNPMNALASNAYTQAWARIGREIGKPKAIVMISAHWFVPESAVTTMTHPRTIHDFAGFPQELHRVKYPAPGAPDLARRLHMVLSPIAVRLDESWGLDHGTWSVLRHVYPDADVPVIQFSIDETRPARFHYELGARLSPLRDEGILIAGSGNLVHNLHTYAWGRHPAEPYEWAVRFEERARALMQVGDHDPLIGYEALGRDAQLSIPTPEHYLPLLYVLGAQQPGDAVSFPVEGVDGGSISMLAVKVG
ncbi:MAG TPA: 4,5-DOPA dioxygenase extradiol [Rhizomicrobium sp.]|nr:4,5-DOPA dioxygenase extradiol [Rhizomicrobium sp.]